MIAGGLVLPSITGSIAAIPITTVIAALILLLLSQTMIPVLNLPVAEAAKKSSDSRDGSYNSEWAIDQLHTLTVQTVKVPKEKTMDDVRRSRLVLLEGIDNAIQRLIKSEHPNTSIGMFDTTHIAQLLKTDQLEAAIKELNKLQARVIAVFGYEAANREVVPQIQNLISVLKQQH